MTPISSPQGFLQSYGAPVVHMLLTIVGDVAEKGMLLTLPIIDTMLQCFPADAPVLLEGVLMKLLGVMLAGDESDLVCAAIAGVFARVVGGEDLQTKPHFHWDFGRFLP